jgi:DNA-binding NtrC family response regulator
MKSHSAVDILQFGGFVGQSPQVQALFSLLERAASTEVALLVVGEPGTYKEAFAEGVHQKSGRRGPFLVVDCGGGNGMSLEAELFGDERQASYGGEGVERGMFEAASGGTVFLGEVGELSIDLQSKIFRAIESRQIRRVGGTALVPLDVRVIASTSSNLRADLDKKRFRSELYRRLTRLQVRLPPLRERLADIPELVRNIVDELGLTGSGAGDALLDPEFLATLARHPWPGNFRQLRHHVERCNALGDAGLPPSMDEFPSMSGSFRVANRVDSIRSMRAARKA